MTGRLNSTNEDFTKFIFYRELLLNELLKISRILDTFGQK